MEHISMTSEIISSTSVMSIYIEYKLKNSNNNLKSENSLNYPFLGFQIWN